MSKVLYAYFNKDDLLALLMCFRENGVECVNGEPIEINAEKAISQDAHPLLLGNGRSSGIRIAPCVWMAGVLQCGCIQLVDMDDCELMVAFRAVKRIIRMGYAVSKDRSFYYGQGIYQDWTNRKYCFPVCFRYESFEIPAVRLAESFAIAREMGCHIGANHARLRDAGSFDEKSESFVLYWNEADLIESIVDRKWLRYEYGSQCVFVNKKRKRNVESYEFLLDERIKNEGGEEVLQLFFCLREALCDKEMA